MANQSEHTNSDFLFPPIDASDRQIRLFRLGTIRTDSCNNILQRGTLDDDFVALSYCWDGNGSVLHSLTINGQIFYVQQNLYDFLVTIAITPEYSRLRDKRFFIDAICINQSNVTEKEQQIGLMQNIYAGAEEVIAWLGPLPEETDAEVDEDYISVEEHMLNNRFWARLWIVQETVLADTLTIMMGDVVASPENLFDNELDTEDYKKLYETSKRLDIIDDGYSFMYGHCSPGVVDWMRQATERGRSEEEKLELRRLACAYMILTQRQRWQQAFVKSGAERPRRDINQASLPPLHEAILLFGTQRSTCRHDKIFGLLGLAQSRTRVDYSVPVTKLFTQTLLEGLHELANSGGSWDSISRFHLACLSTLGYPNDAALILITFRAMQHCRILPRRGFGANLYIGVRALLLEVLLHDNRQKLIGKEAWFWCSVRHTLVWLWVGVISVPICIALQHQRTYRKRFGPTEQEQREFEGWVSLVDEVAKGILTENGETNDLTDKCLQDWEKEELRGIPGIVCMTGTLGYMLEWPVILIGKTWRLYLRTKQRYRQGFL
ncbi:hypothetical protein LTR15_005525 [Elasticomyces elasticus]|nr:hypothetical protein LTR15_005525 [Elasticomyces elasticus]